MKVWVVHVETYDTEGNTGGYPVSVHRSLETAKAREAEIAKGWGRTPDVVELELED